MELKGEEVYTGWAYSTSRDLYSETWSVDMPPSTAFVKTYLCDHVLFGENGSVEIGILNIRYHLPDNSDGRVNLPGLEWPDSVKAWFNSNITHFTFAIKVGSVPKVKSIRGVALYDPKDGTIHHMHHVLTMEGCEPRDSTLIEKDAITFAIKLGHRTEHLKVLHTPDSINPFAKYRVDTIKLGLIELPKPPEIRNQ